MDYTTHFQQTTGEPQLATHWECAQCYEAATKLFYQAATHHRQRGALVESAAFARRALSCVLRCNCDLLEVRPWGRHMYTPVLQGHTKVTQCMTPPGTCVHVSHAGAEA